MRLLIRDKQRVTIRGTQYAAFVRRVSGGFTAHSFGAYDGETLQWILPPGVLFAPGERGTLGGKPFLCLSCTRYPGSVQALVRRCPA